MALPREVKKAETRAKLMRETARLVITHGTEHTTVTEVASAVGVSARTFHNYFPSREEALEEFANTSASALRTELEKAEPGANMLEVLEAIVLDSFCSDTHDNMDNIAAVFRVCSILEALKGTGQCDRFLPEGLSQETRIALHGAIAIAWAAVDAYYQLPEPRDPAEGEQIVRDAFGTARKLAEITLP